MNRWLLGTLIPAALLTLANLSILSAGEKGEPGVKSLFNGKDLTGWDTYLARPHPSMDIPGLKRNEKGQYLEDIGLNKDPIQNFTVVEKDGQPAIRISGQVFGALTTKDEYENYHIRLEVKWGEKRWPPREKAVRDSGLLYHCYGPQNGAGNGWMRSLECQIQEHDCGDFWSVGGPKIDVEVEKKGNALVWKKGGELVKGTRSRIIKSVEKEDLTGWNVIEVYTIGSKAVHVVNGTVNLVLSKARYEEGGKEIPLTRGKIQLQSEGAEVFYRNITIRPISAFPKQIAEQI